MGESPVIAMSSMNRLGRFGNQIFQFGFLKDYALRHDLTVQTAPWVGQKLFGHSDPPPAKGLPILYETSNKLSESILSKLGRPLQNIDLWGYFLYHTSYYGSRQQHWRSLFQPIGEILKRVTLAEMHLRARGQTLVGIHLRRGDKIEGRNFIPPIESYQRWIADLWTILPMPLLYVASEEPEGVLDAFSEYNPVTATDLPIALHDVQFYVDFYILSRCDVLAISNSTFSFAAAMLNENASHFVRPLPGMTRLSKFHPWNDIPIIPDELHSEKYADDLLQRCLSCMGGVQPGQPQSEIVERFRSLRRDVADLWLSADEGYAVISYFSTIGDVHRMCLASPLRQEPLSGEEGVYRDKLCSELRRTGLSGEWAMQHMLAAMLYCEPEELPVTHDLTLIPQFLRSDYIAYLRRCGTAFT